MSTTDQEVAPAKVPESKGDRAFDRCVVAVAVVGFAIRVVNAFALPKHPPIVSDARFYDEQANLLAKGHGFADPFLWLTRGRLVPSAVHPPLFPLVLAAASWLGGTSSLAHRITAGGIGVVTIVAVAFIARELAGSAVGIVAAALAAIYPNFWGLEGSLMSESLAAALVAVALLVAFRFAKQPSVRHAALLAVLIALAALTRPETILLLPFLALPLIWTRRGLPARRRMALLGAVVLITGVVLAPWLVRNLTGFSRPVVFSTNGDEVLGVANCQASYYDPPFLGYWFIGCVGQHPLSTDDAENTSLDRKRGVHYLSTHLNRFVGTVIWARLGRVADVYRPFENSRYSATEGRKVNVALAGLWVYWACLPLALVGGLTLWRRNRGAVGILLAPSLVVIVTAIYAYGAVRFRAIAEPSLVVLAAIGIVTLWQRVCTPRGAASAQ
jgi:4-amino-4-deoxy-L-arabinose transferase-like glycosyltransferase